MLLYLSHPRESTPRVSQPRLPFSAVGGQFALKLATDGPQRGRKRRLPIGRRRNEGGGANGKNCPSCWIVKANDSGTLTLQTSFVPRRQFFFFVFSKSRRDSSLPFVEIFACWVELRKVLGSRGSAPWQNKHDKRYIFPNFFFFFNHLTVDSWAVVCRSTYCRYMWISAVGSFAKRIIQPLWLWAINQIELNVFHILRGELV